MKIVRDNSLNYRPKMTNIGLNTHRLLEIIRITEVTLPYHNPLDIQLFN